ncbi:pyridoxal phosphate-dependent aminotransferase [Paenibacillus wynnii]|uniref:pyridoxal phosphate-dependent aminotransferase n=1 Tax=Paenibacillus wynnii TaxID=268407 RepID=UPI000689A280|nr:pyridoxal phosphate-dependent aminotransferase [Paenibacillus wynnii]
MKNWISDKVSEKISTPSAIRAMFMESKRVEKEYGKEAVFDFSLGNPIVEPPVEFTQKGIEILNHKTSGKHSYIEHQGLAKTREVVADHINHKYNTNHTLTDIIMTAGAAGALNVIHNSLLNFEDEVIVFTPYFSEYSGYITNYGGKPIYVKLDSDFSIDFSALAKSITHNTRAIIINTPHNPTGKAFHTEELKKLNRLVEESEAYFETTIYIIFDSPYDQLFYGDSQCNPFLIFNRLIYIGSFSKDFGIAGERLGYIVLPEKLEAKEIILEAIIYSTRILGFVNAPVFVQRVISEMSSLKVDPAPYKERRDLMVKVLQKAGYNVTVPEGGIFIFPESPIQDDQFFCDFLAKNYRVFTVPGSSFKGSGYFRISFSNPLNKIADSEHAFRNARQTLLARA